MQLSPTYDRKSVRTGIVHLGVGGFHRSHLAGYVHELLQLGCGDEWGITGVGVLPQDRRMAEVMAAQDCLYTLVLKHPDGTTEPTVIGSIVDYLLAPDDPEAVLRRMADPATRIVSLTVTEGGYHRDPTTGELSRDPELMAEFADGAPPRTAFGYVVEALARRRAQGTPPFTVMSCDNVPGNGRVARAMIVAFARLRRPELADWIEREVAFPSSMVDRITPVTTDADRERLASEHGISDAWPVGCEPFRQWVLEDDFPAGRPDFGAVGAELVTDVTPYEEMKLRLLNAGHQAIAFLGYLAGHRYAHEAVADPDLAAFLMGYLDDEGAPTLRPVPAVDLPTYQKTLLERFGNPQVADTLARLCAETSDRIPTFLLPVVRDQLASRGSVRHAALIVAAWARYAEGVDERGRPIEVVDRCRDEVMARAARNRTEPLAFLENRALFGDLVDEPRFTEPYVAALRSLHESGATATLHAFVRPGADCSADSCS